MPYTGQWIRKGFTYLTGPTQTSMIIYVRNNAPGGGGNDWAIDDIGVASCYPSMLLTPNKPDLLCQGADGSTVDWIAFALLCAAIIVAVTRWIEGARHARGRVPSASG